MTGSALSRLTNLTALDVTECYAPFDSLKGLTGLTSLALDIRITGNSNIFRAAKELSPLFPNLTALNDYSVFHLLAVDIDL
jgi:hypothetical protein